MLCQERNVTQRARSEFMLKRLARTCPRKLVLYKARVFSRKWRDYGRSRGKGVIIAEPLSAQIIRLIPQVVMLYHRLVLVVSSSGTGKTAALQAVAKHTGYCYINVNLELSQCMLELTQWQRQLQVSRLL